MTDICLIVTKSYEKTKINIDLVHLSLLSDFSSWSVPLKPHLMCLYWEH